MRAFFIFLLVMSQSNGVSAPATSLANQAMEWGVYSGNPESTHYSQLAQINRDNVKDLQVAWEFDSGDAFPSSENECNPIVVNGVLYATTPKVNVIALNAATGKLLWRFDPNVGLHVVGKMRSRGVTYWSDGKDQRIFVAVRQGAQQHGAHHAENGRIGANS